MTEDFYCLSPEKMEKLCNFMKEFVPYYNEAEKSMMDLRIDSNLEKLLENAKQFLDIPSIREMVSIVEDAYRIK